MNKKLLNNPKIILILQSRLNSSRLPQKAILPLGEKTVLYQVLKNLTACKVSDYFLATDFNSELVFSQIVKEAGFKCFSGSEEDVLERFCLLIKQERPDVVVRATGDNPFLFTDAANFSIERFLELNKKSKVDYFTLSGLPHGSGIEIFLAESLLEAEKQTTLSYDHEHVAPALYNHPEKFTSVFEPAPKCWNFPELRTTIDTYFDYKKAEKLYKILDCKNQPIVNSKKVIEACLLPEVRNPILFIPTTKKGRGTGHLRRCLDLAKQLDSFLYLNFISLENTPNHLSKLIFEKDFPIENLIFSRINLIKLGKNQEEKPFSLVVLDSFISSIDDINAVEKLGKILSLDDGQENKKTLNKINYLLDIIPSSKLKRKGNLINSNFIPKPKNIKKEKVLKIKNALVSIGGEDPAGFSEIAKKSLENLGINTTCIDVKNPIPNLKEELYKYDLLVTHYGFTAFEGKAAGCKVILVETTKLHKKLAKSEGFYCLSKKDFTKLTNSFLENLVEKSTKKSTKKTTIDFNESENDLKTLIQKLSKAKEHSCPVCKSSKIDGKVIFRNASRTIKKCRNCKTLYINIETTPISDYSESYFFTDYKNQYGKTYLEDFEAIKKQGLRRGKIIKKNILKTKNKIESPKLLDIGCAYGPFLSAAKDLGFIPFGTDISKSATDYVSKELGFPSFHGDFTITDFKQKFRAVSMWYVIEHFENLDIVLKKVNSLLEKSGIFAFSTPSASGVSGKYKRKSFLANSPVDHYSIWSFQSAKKVMKKYGFKILKIYSTGHHPERFFKKSISKDKNPKLWKIINLFSRIFKLGDTFEIYCKKIGNVHEK